jgi:hippurate hydrolase
MYKPSLLDDARAISSEIVALRRAIHAEPELGLNTPLTRDKVRAALANLPLEWAEGPSTTGLVATLKGGAGEGRCVLLRGDMDALPMPEETGLEFASTVPGAMHACGHDAHTAMLFGAARLLCARRDQLRGEIRFMFQPGEEGFHGARLMIEDGLLGGGSNRPLPDAAFALHVMPNAPHGMVAGRAGPLLASADQFEIVVEGSGGHAAMPHQAMDPVPVACEIVSAFQTLVTRQFDAHDPVVITVARIEAGTAHNIIADFAALKGTIRTLSPRHRVKVHEAIARLAGGIAQAHGMNARIEIAEGFPVTLCDPRAIDLAERVSGELFGAAAFRRLDQPIMGAEDFSYVLEKVPGAMFFLGVAHQGADWHKACAIHSPRMVVDETTLPHGAALLAGLAERFLEHGWG